MSTLTIRPRAGRSISPGVPGPTTLHWFSATVGLWIRRSRQRTALRELAERSDCRHLLADIGVTPEQALRASAKWFWQP